MSYLYGRIAFERFDVSGRDIKLLDESYVQKIDDHAIGKTGALTADGVEVGFTAGRHVLDLDFSLAKNIVHDALVFGMRVDTNKLPSDLMKAYTEMELAALLAEAGQEFPSRKLKQQAREAAEQRLSDEAKSGRFRRMKQFPVLWDIRQQVVYFGGSNQTAMEQFANLFKEAFGRTLTRRTSGHVAFEVATRLEKTRSLEDLSPTAFTGPGKTMPFAWISEAMGTRDFLGNEFLLWLWWRVETEGDTFELSDDSTATLMMTRTLALECPLAETGKETISSLSPVQLPEAKRAVQSGKLPRKAGITLVRHDQQYDLTLQAETFGVSGASLPKLDKMSPADEHVERVDQIREFAESLDLLFATFVERRLSSGWRDDVRAIREWLDKEE
jgi:hypothetical protein